MKMISLLKGYSIHFGALLATVFIWVFLGNRLLNRVSRIVEKELGREPTFSEVFFSAHVPGGIAIVMFGVFLTFISMFYLFLQLFRVPITF